ncbi:putative E3 ubiquitin-protein ligase XBOS35 [Ananas comosus]|uniref:Putative E3 ubiquitin-protein ligase XBOS35 n=1 Tax=Ananas comosus TaxID=4615 RepID=A0A199V4H8_ANACO|nr:putative E3 ubiquitin-protein ligase XBOS35 [Ananas comosus]
MGLFELMGDSFGCSAAGERLVSAARDGDFQEAQALLQFNPRLAKYSTFGVRNSPLHYSASQGHHEVVSLLIESGVDINLRNLRGQTALMLACLHGRWKVVQILMLFKANIHRKDYLSGGTAFHFAALNGHTRCIRLLFSDYVPSSSEFWDIMRGNSNSNSKKDALNTHFDEVALSKIVNKKADGGITALHLAALNGHAESVQLLLDLGACVSETTVDDGSTIDLIGAGSTPLHYAACGGSAACCQLLIAGGASLTAVNAKGWTPVMVARSWHKSWLEAILSKQPEGRLRALPSPYLSLPLMSIVKIAREYGWRKRIQSPACFDPCVICLEMKCKFCTECALHLCSNGGSSATSARGPPGSIPCPLCRQPIVSFAKISSATPLKELPWTKTPLALCTTGSSGGSSGSGSVAHWLAKPNIRYSDVELGCSTSRSLSFRRVPLMKLNPALCVGDDTMSPCRARCSRPELKRSASHRESSRKLRLSNCS